MAGQGRSQTGEKNGRAAAKFLDLLALARRDDIPAILSRMPAPDLVAGLRRLGPLVPDPVLDHVLGHGPLAARLALADTARRFDTWRSDDDHPLSVRISILARRLLRLFDPDVDEALFALDLPHGDRPAWAWVRRAVVRDRVGPAGEPVVPPGLRAAIGDRLRGMGARPGRADRRLLEVLAEAADPAVSGSAVARLGRGPVLAVPRPEKFAPGYDEWLAHWDAPGTASSLYAPDWDEVLALTDGDHLYEEGWISGEQAYFATSSVGLDEIVVREDVPPEVMDRIAQHYGSYLAPAWRPDLRTVDRFERWGGRWMERRRLLAVEIARGLHLGTLTAQETLERVGTASHVIELAQAEWPIPGAEGTYRGRAELRDLLTRVLDARFGADARRWAMLVVALEHGSGPLGPKIDEVAAAPLLGEEPPVANRPGEDLHSPLFAANVLLSLAHPDMAAEVLRILPQRARSMLGGRPLFPALADFALGPLGDQETRLALVRKPWVPEEVVLRLVTDPASGPDVLWAVLGHQDGPTVRRAAMRRLLAEGAAWDRVVDGVRARPRGLSLVFADEDDPARIASLLKRIRELHFLDELPDRLRLYARLAELAGPEPVWAIELEHARMLDRMAPAVRASMASGDKAPLLLAAEQTPIRTASGDDQVLLPSERSSPLVGRAPEELARAEFDGRPDRWLALAALLRRTSLLPDDEVVADLMERVIAAHP